MFTYFVHFSLFLLCYHHSASPPLQPPPTTTHPSPSILGYAQSMPPPSNDVRQPITAIALPMFAYYTAVFVRVLRCVQPASSAVECHGRVAVEARNCFHQKLLPLLLIGAQKFSFNRQFHGFLGYYFVGFQSTTSVQTSQLHKQAAHNHPQHHPHDIKNAT